MKKSVNDASRNTRNTQGGNHMRELYHLNDGWTFYGKIRSEQNFQAEKESLKKVKVDIPHTVKLLPLHYFDEHSYQGVYLYEKTVDIPEQFMGKKIFLEFEGVANMAVIYINGKRSFHSESPFVPFAKKISGELRFGEKNTIEVLVDSRELPYIPPFGNVVDFLTFGGIYREVQLHVLPSYFIEDVFAFGQQVLKEEKDLIIKTTLSGNHKGTLVYKLFEDEEKRSLGEVLSSGIRAVENRKMRHTLKVRDVSLWSIQTPKLYLVQVSLLGEEGELLDEKVVRIGFREALFKEDGFYLNGEKLKLRGLNRHQSYPYVGYAMPKSMQELDAEILKKDLGVHLVRTSHYPQSKWFLDACDRLGLLVFEEIPGWQHIGDEQFKEISKYNLKRMIKRDRNHPSIILWGVRINESQDDTTFYTEMNKIAHLYDETRPTGGVRNFQKSELLEDVYTYNDFIHNGQNRGLSDPTEVLPRKAPYLVTEFNGHMFPTKSSDPEDRRVSHALRHSKVLSEMMESTKISGAIGWCMTDYNTHGDFGSGDRICHHGVLDAFRQKKLAAYVYSSQKEDEPVLMISSSMNIGDHDGGSMGKVYAFTNCDYVELYKNGKFVKKYEKQKDQGLKHPPIAMDDFIGGLLEEEEGFSRRDAERVKKVLKSAAVHGLNLPLFDKATMGMILLKYKLSMEDAVRLFSKHYAGWGQEGLTYTFKGYKDGKEVKTVTRGQRREHRMVVEPQKNILTVEETYDVAMISIQLLDEHEDVLSYSSEPVLLKTEGAVEILGPKFFSLSGGQGAFYVRTKGSGNGGKVFLHTEHYGDREIAFNIEHKIVSKL